MTTRRAHLLAPALLLAGCARPPAAPSDTERMAQRIVTALAPAPGERAIVRYDPDLRSDLPDRLTDRLASAGVEVGRLPYGPAERFTERLAAADIYIWLPDGTGGGTTPDQAAALGEWLDARRGRQIHFHWGAGTVALDGLPGEHGPAYDSIYLAALDIDYTALDSIQRAATALLRSGPIRVTTPAGTDLTFELGDRPINPQNGDATAARMASARVRIDREIELPAGVIRVAPVESTVTGRLVVPSARFGEGTVHGLVLEFRAGRVERYAADSGVAHFETTLQQQPALRSFREIGIGFNPALQRPAGQPGLPYYGYGAGVVRLSLGNNLELGGTVSGQGVRWLFFDDATVRVADRTLVQDGRLASP